MAAPHRRLDLPAILRTATVLLVPPRCPACRRPCEPAEAVCARCRAALERSPSPRLRVGGIDRAAAAVSYGAVARRVVAALKFEGLWPMAGLAAELIAERAGELLVEGATLVPVPAAPLRAAWRGHDPAEGIAAALGARTALPVRSSLGRADLLRRQRGRDRTARVADPPEICSLGPVPEHAVLVDDVATTGATLTACALALWDGGSARIDAVTFAAAPARRHDRRR